MDKKIMMEKLFPCPPSNNYDKLKIDYESISFITTPINSDIISMIIKSQIPENMNICDMTILDCTACVGGDTISFSRIFGTVIATEIKKSKYEMLVNNITEFELYNVIPINCDCLKIFKKINNIDVIYFDPPWGGRNYKNYSDLTLYIGNESMDNIVNTIFDENEMNSNVKMIVIKLPKNYDLYKLYNNTKNNNVSMYMYDLTKMKIIIYRRNDWQKY